MADKAVADPRTGHLCLLLLKDNFFGKNRIPTSQPQEVHPVALVAQVYLVGARHQLTALTDITDLTTPHINNSHAAFRYPLI